MVIFYRENAWQPARGCGHVTNRRRLPRAASVVPRAHQLLHHRLLCRVARRCAGSSCRQISDKGPITGAAARFVSPNNGDLQTVPRRGAGTEYGLQVGNREGELRDANVVLGADQQVLGSVVVED